MDKNLVVTIFIGMISIIETVFINLVGISQENFKFLLLGLLILIFNIQITIFGLLLKANNEKGGIKE